MSITSQIKRRILVAGGSGFLGSHLVDRLLAEGHTVFCLDDLSSGSNENIRPHLNNPRFHIVCQDVCDPIDIDVDEIWNFACPASPIKYQTDPIKTMRTSVLGAMNLLELARTSNCPIFQASTSEVYGDPKIHPQNERYWGHVNPIGIRACYDEGKRCAETLFFDYHRRYHVKIKVARIFNTFGPRMQTHDGRAVSNFIVQALMGEPITVYGNGDQTRSFCFVDDTIEACLRLMRTNDSVTGPVNIGNPIEMTIRNIAERVANAVGSKSSIVSRPLPQDDPKQRCPDISLATSILQWTPETSFDNGLRTTISYFRSVLSDQIRTVTV